MPLETAEYFDTLQPDWPLGTDPENQGDDHIRMIKQVIQNTFPALNGAVTGAPEQLNDLTSGVKYIATSDDGTVPAHFTFLSPHDGATNVPITVNSMNVAQLNKQPLFALTWRTVIDLLMPVGHVLIRSNNVNPATYLGFGTWTARSGYLAGVGSVTDSAGLAQSIANGASAGTWRINNASIIGTTLNLVMDAVASHNHGNGINNPDNYSQAMLYGTRAVTDKGKGWSVGSGHAASEVVTSSDGGHTPTGKVTIGSGTATSGTVFTPPRYAFYVWERTA